MNPDRVNLFLETLGGAADDLMTECLAARVGGLTAAAPRTDGRPPMPAHNAIALALARVIGAYNALAAAAPTGLVPQLDAPAMLDAVETQRFRAENAVRYAVEDRGGRHTRDAVEDVRRRRIITAAPDLPKYVEGPPAAVVLAPGQTKLIDGTYVTNRTGEPFLVLASGVLAGTPQEPGRVFTDSPAPGESKVFDGTYPAPPDRGPAGHKSPKTEGRGEQ